MSDIVESLIDNSKSAVIGCVELHNKPVFQFRYEVCTILIINGWELILKAYIAEHHPKVKLIKKDGTSKSFEDCLSFVSGHLGKDFMAQTENLNKLYEYRCHIIHFYKDPVDSILFSLLHKSILFYNSFLQNHFNQDLAEETNLMLLPIGFKPFATPVDFLSKESKLNESSSAVQTFIKSIVDSTQNLANEGVEDAILTGFNMSVINENRIKNADIIAGITKEGNESNLTVANVLGAIKVTNDENVKKVRIDENTVFKTVYTIPYLEVVKKCRELYSDFKQGPKFNQVMGKLKNNPTFHKKRYLNVEETGMGKDYYTSGVFDELSKIFTLKEN